MQESATKFVPVSKYRFGVPVLTDDGEEGSLDSLIVDGPSRAITGIRARFGFFGRELYTLPITAIRHANPDKVELHVTYDEMKRDYSTVTAATLLAPNTRVIVGNKTIGKLTQVTVNRETHVLRHLVVRSIRGEELVAASSITAIEGRHIVVASGANAPEQTLLPYRPDEALYDEIHAAIFDYPRLRVDLPGIGIRVIDGTLWLQGNVSSDLNTRLVQDQLANIRGLGEIHNELVADTDLASAVAEALSRDPRTARQQIGVYPQLGVINLRGRVRTEEARAAANEIAHSVRGARDVNNALIVDPEAEVIPVLAGVTNQEDRIPGGG
ncbi:MAG TPA: BON domain-containing protein [Ktedonobacterales bacterium]